MAYARPGSPVIVVTGDGAVGFSLGEMEAITRHRLPVVVVIMNNARWGASMGFQLRPDGPGRVVGTALADADYHDAMRAFGGHGVRVRTMADLRRALDDALGAGGPACINVATHAKGAAAEMALLR